MKYEKLSKAILENVGGKENIAEITHCITRLRFKLKDNSKLNDAKIKTLDTVVGTANANGQYQIIIGPNVKQVYDDFMVVSGVDNSVVAEATGSFSIMDAVNTFASIFTPLVPALAGSGIIKGLLLLLTTYGLMDKAGGAYNILTAASDSVFYFMPIILACTCAQKFKCNLAVSMSIAASLIYPNLVTFMGAGAVDFFGIPVVNTTYTSTVIPAFIAILVYSYLEKFLNKVIPNMLKSVLVPTIGLAVMVPATLIVFGPFGNYASAFIGNVFTTVTGFSPLLAGAFFGGLYPILVMFGMHRALVPIGINEVATLGSTALWAFTGPSNFSQAGAAFGVALKEKDKNLRSVALSASVTALFGISEPALYGVNVKYRKPMIGVVIGGAIGGAIAGIGGARAYAVAIPSLLTLPAFMGAGFAAFMAGVVVAFVVAAGVTMVLGIESETTEETAKIEKKKLTKHVVAAPVQGQLKPITECTDSAFASKALGEGCVIIPTDNKVYAPCDGTIKSLFPTNHALGIETKDGLQVLVHIGIDTVELNGKHFVSYVKMDDVVKKGDLLIEFDREAISKANYSLETMVVILNTKDYLDVLIKDVDEISTGEDIITIL